MKRKLSGRFHWAIGVFILLFMFNDNPGIFGFMFGLWSFGCVWAFTEPRKEDDDEKE